MVLTGLCRLEQCQAVLAFGFVSFHRFRRQSGNSSIGWIHDERGSGPCRSDRLEHRVIRASDVPFAAAFDALVSTGNACSLLVEIGPFLIRKLFLVGILGRSLQRRLIRIGPDSLNVGVAPCGLEYPTRSARTRPAP